MRSFVGAIDLLYHAVPNYGVMVAGRAHGMYPFDSAICVFVIPSFQDTPSSDAGMRRGRAIW